MRKGRHDAARHAVERLGNKNLLNSSDTVAMMRRVIELETSDKSPNYIELFKGTDFRRTAIVCAVYAAQNLSGNLIANQAVYFFERESLTQSILQYQSHTNLLFLYRGRRIHPNRIRPRSHHISSPNDLRHALLDPNDLLWSPQHLSLGFRRELSAPVCPRHRRIRRRIDRSFVGPGITGSHHLGALHTGSRTSFVGYYWRNVCYSAETVDYWYWTCVVLHH